MANELVKAGIGKKFGRWEVVGFAHRNIRGNYWRCRCDCGNERVLVESNLKSGHSRSCGCYRKDRARESSYRHGHAKDNKVSSTYTSWFQMVGRCTNPSAFAYKWYGARGITVCDRWRGERGFASFLADMGEKPNGLSLDRIDNNGNYEPGNCRWATHKEQANNRRNNVRIKDGESFLTLKQIAEKHGVDYRMLWHHVFDRKLPLEDAIVRARSAKSQEVIDAQ